MTDSIIRAMKRLDVRCDECKDRADIEIILAGSEASKGTERCKLYCWSHCPVDVREQWDYESDIKNWI